MRILPHLAIAAVVSGHIRPSKKEYEKQQAEKKNEAKEASAKDDKMAAVKKVIELLADLKASVLSEGEKEAKSYNKFACFCKDTMTEKTEAVTKGEDDKESLSTHINELKDKRDELDNDIEGYERDIEEAEEFMKKKTVARKKDNDKYEKKATDLKGAIDAIAAALQKLKASKPSFLQVQSVAGDVREVALWADAMGLGGASIQASLSGFLQDDPSVPMENYKFKSQKVIDMLESLQKDVRQEKAKLDEDEVDAVQKYDKYMLDKNFEVKTKNMLMQRAKKKRAETIEEIAMSSEELTTVASDLLDDKQYVMELSKICGDKAKTWDQRSKVRADELSALTSAIGIIKKEVSEKTSAATVRLAQRGTSVRLALALQPSELDEIEAEAEQMDGKTYVSFLQKHIVSRQPNLDVDEERSRAVAAVLKSQGDRLHSALLTSLATQIGKNDPFAKVKTLIEELIKRLQSEAENEAEQKSFCDKSIGEAKEKRDNAAGKIKELNNQMSGLEARQKKLKEELDDLKSDIQELVKARADAKKARKEEKTENEATVKTAEEGLEALKKAIDVLEKFYKDAGQEEVDLDFTQTIGPEDDAPDAGFDSGEAYQGNAKSGGVLGMLDVIKSDFERTVTETKKAEDEAQQDYVAFEDESGKALSGKKDAKKEKTGQLDDVEGKLEDDDKDLSSQTKILQNAIEELLELKPACIETGMSYEERVERRQDEINALKKGLCVLTKFKEYGVENVAENC